MKFIFMYFVYAKREFFLEKPIYFSDKLGSMYSALTRKVELLNSMI